MEGQDFEEYGIESEDFSEVQENKKTFKFNLTHARVILCSIILLVLAILKAFLPMMYKSCKESYNVSFKENKIYSSEILNAIQSKFDVVKIQIKEKINNL